MSVIFRKSLKGIDEVAFKSGGLPLRLVSYLLAVDGEASVDQLTARHQHLPSMPIVLQGLAEQGYLEVAGTAANVVDIGQMRVGNGANYGGGTPNYQSAPQNNQSYSPPPPTYAAPPAPPANFFPELDIYKTNMIRDVTALLGADASPVIGKIQACRTRDDLFATMMGVKKIILIYNSRDAADKFGARYAVLAG